MSADTIKMRWVPTLFAVMAAGVSLTSLVLELTVLLDLRTNELNMASDGTLVTQTPHGECVGYAKGSLVHDHYKPGAKYGGAFNLFSQDVNCEEEDALKQLGRLTAASVHALRWNYNHYTQNNTFATNLAATYHAAAAAALGSTSELLSYDTAVSVLSNLHAPPTSCFEIYNETAPGALSTPPAQAVVMACDVEPVSGPVLPEMDSVLMAHCLGQFHYARYEADIDDFGMMGLGGTMRLPVYGEIMDPWRPVTTNAGLSNTSQPWHIRSRVLVGYRAGLAVFGVAIGVLLSTFLLFDSLFILLAELTMVWRLKAIHNNNGEKDSSFDTGTKDPSFWAAYQMFAGLKHVRLQRWILAWFLFILLLIFRCVFVWTPSNFGRLMPITECSRGDGWKEDTQVTTMELVSTILIVVAIVWVPFSHTVYINLPDYNDAYEGREVQTNTLKANKPLVEDPSLRNVNAFIAVTILGSMVLFWSQASVTHAIGEAWAESVASPSPGDDWNSERYGEVLYEYIVGLMGIAISTGMILSVILSRWNFGAVTCQANLVLVVWLAVAVLSYVPLVFVESLSWEESVYARDCEKLNNFAKQSCESRFYTYVTGVIIIFLPAALVGALCLSRNSGAVLNTKTDGEAGESAPLTVTQEASIAKGMAPRIYFRL